MSRKNGSLCQYSNAFEFNESYLLLLLDHVILYQKINYQRSARRFGSFLGKSEKERREMRIDEETSSLWGWIIDLVRVDVFQNEEYTEDNDPLRPLCSTSILRGLKWKIDF